MSTSTAATTASSRMTSPSSIPQYKGKITHRSWQQLPPEIIRLIATHYLLDVSGTKECPQTWGVREAWPSRMMYMVLRDAIEIEKLMLICPTWGTAIEKHLFWHQACVVIDPLDVLLHHSVIQPHANNASSVAAPIRLTPYIHFRNISNCSCFICRVNNPYRSNGLATVKRNVHTYYLGAVPACREHRKVTFCGICLREAPNPQHEEQYNAVSCAENEDEETWPNIEATCRTCRSEWLWKKVLENIKDTEAVGGPKWNAADWETRQSIDAFIEMGEGTISEIIVLAQEKYWLRKYTKLADMLQQAIAASRYASREEGYPREGYSSGEELSDEDEEDPELLSITEDAGGVRDLAINDWARNRILDGHWFSPADQWYENQVGESTVVPTVHPCSWSLDRDVADENVAHPRPSTVHVETPPTFQLCELMYRAFQKQMRVLLLPAMNNIVRKLVIECTADRVDPALKASRMAPEDVAEALRDESMWYNGIDWLERRANRRREDRERELQRQSREEEEDRESSASSKSDDATSPVLSTSTLGTTPSPPPAVSKKGGQVRTDGPPVVPIPVSPVLETPTLIHAIPFIPVTTSHMPHFSAEAFKLVWREACSPLYQCRCKICERAMVKANIDAGNVVAIQVQEQQPTQNPIEISDDRQSLGEIRIEESEEEVQVEEVEEVAAVPEEEEGEEEVEEEEETSTTTTDDMKTYAVNPRKRSSRELDDDADGDSDSLSLEDDAERSRTPPKRVRREGQYSPNTVILSASARLKKRSSEELDDDNDGLTRSPSRDSAKRLRLERKNVNESAEESGGTSPPTSVVPSAEDELDEEVEVSVTSTRGRRPAESPCQVPRGGRKVAPSLGVDPDAKIGRRVSSLPGVAVARVSDSKV